MLRSPHLGSALLLSALLSLPSLAYDPLVLRESPLTIGQITVNRENVFEVEDGKPLRWPYNWGNKLHIVTKEEFIREDLLFKEGDPYDPELVVESERLLRSRPIFRYVRILTEPREDGRVDVRVETEDVWTTSIQMGFGTAGGETFYDLGVLESNFLGKGRRVGAFVSQDIDRFRRGLSYGDPHLFGSRWEGFVGYGRDEKGRDWEGRILRPFYSTRVRHSVGASFLASDDEDRLFFRGDEVAKFQHATRNGRGFAAFALSDEYARARNIIVAYERQDDEFHDVRSPFFPLVLQDRVVSAPMLGFEFKNVSFKKFHGVRTFDRDEDINLGWEWMAEAGPSLKDLGATRDGGFGRLRVRKVISPADDVVWFNRLDWSGRVESEQVQDGVTRLRSEAFWVGWREKNTASLRGEWVASKNLDPESQFLLGGENGLRAYPVREFAGENTLLVTLENRRVVLYDWLRLMTVGWAVFADAGEVWFANEGFRMAEVKSDVGFGIRFAPSRSTDPGLIRIDLAYALQENDRTSRLALNVGADIRFGEASNRKFDQ